jgi:hypothetical protein
MSDSSLDLTTSPWTEAVDRFGGKTPIGSALRSDDWEGMPLALKERAFWTAGLTNARTLSAMQQKLREGLTQTRPGGIGMDRARFVADMRNLMGAAPGDSGDLTDITANKRLSLIWDFQMQDAHGFAARKADMDPNLLDAFPAYRLLRVESRRIPRDWYERWGEAGAAIGWEGASKTDLVALKTSPIWVALSRFGRPWPPFDYNSGMGLEDVDRSEAEDLGLLDKSQSPADRLQQLGDAAAKQQQDWNDGLEASVKGLSDDARDWLKRAFGDQISIDGDTAAWLGNAAAETPEPETPPQPADPENRAAQKSWADEQMHPDAYGLTTAERTAAAGYQEEDYFTLNRALRGGKDIAAMDPPMRTQVASLDAAIARTATPADLRVFRGVPTQIVETWAPGDIQSDLGFMSTSLARGGARPFAEGAILEIQVPAGTSGLYMDELHKGYGHEVELLLPRDTKLRILSKQKIGQICQITAEVIR